MTLNLKTLTPNQKDAKCVKILWTIIQYVFLAWILGLSDSAVIIHMLTFFPSILLSSLLLPLYGGLKHIVSLLLA